MDYEHQSQADSDKKGMEVPAGSLTVEERVNLISDAKELFEIREGEKEKFAQMFGF